MRESLYQITTLISVGCGLSLGFLLKLRLHPSLHQLHWIYTPGEIFLNILQIFAVPLIVTSVIAGVTQLNNQMSKKAAIFTGLYICGTTFLSVAIGMTLVLIAKPGEGQDLTSNEKLEVPPFSLHLVLQDLLRLSFDSHRNMFPESFLQAFYEQYKTELIHVKRGESVHISQNDTEMQLAGTYIAGPNMMGLIIWSFVIGILLNRAGHKAKTTVEAIHCLNNAIKIIFQWILWYLPIGVLFLVVHQVLEINDWAGLIKLGKLSGLIILGLVIQAFCVLPGIYFIILRMNPYVIFRKVSKALTTAFIIASSAATLPITLQCCEEKVHVNGRLCRLMLPIATTVNMNGTAVYLVIAAVFVAQINNIVLDVGEIISISLTVCIVSFGTAAIPVSGAMTTLLVLTSSGLPAEDAYILLVMEWLIDHFATTLNVLGDCFGVAVINHLCRDELTAYEEEYVCAIREAENDLLCLEPDDQHIPPASCTPSGSVSP
ncbi:excitatory amino acid transporter 3-like isoform X2 [Gambusia affinis]|uniref:excitatory amino acid transporter 3-like isoform X2 n=1 Tax=Gambusia affinis TaxID=33528 RepID=UPI001CDCF203|nr:excitatory amino acid transporter 3-like isoform X2 [Gambusia affinis]